MKECTPQGSGSESSMGAPERSARARSRTAHFPLAYAMKCVKVSGKAESSVLALLASRPFLRRRSARRRARSTCGGSGRLRSSCFVCRERAKATVLRTSSKALPLGTFLLDSSSSPSLSSSLLSSSDCGGVTAGGGKGSSGHTRNLTAGLKSVTSRNQSSTSTSSGTHSWLWNLIRSAVGSTAANHAGAFSLYRFWGTYRSSSMSI
mmetsp:Transcript_105124/g.327724  ORF Transcript_105124/g.327724 Transcript_105124/m.327724 type:complete len:206 (-) Transcript_105124:338-955(-)